MYVCYKVYVVRCVEIEYLKIKKHLPILVTLTRTEDLPVFFMFSFSFYPHIVSDKCRNFSTLFFRITLCKYVCRCKVRCM